jgi:glycosyltransferase involved in cell wall biosynthesis
MRSHGRLGIDLLDLGAAASEPALRILIVSPGYPPTTGGIEKVVQATSEALVTLGHQVEVAAQQRGEPTVSTEQSNGVVVRRFPATNSRDFPVSASLVRHVRSRAKEFDVIHVHNYHAVAAASALLVARPTPIVFSPHFHGVGNSRLAELAHRPYAAIGRRLVTRADHIVAVSDAERALFVERFPHASDLTSVVHNGVDSTAIAAAEPLSKEPQTVLVLGRLEAYKHVDLVIDAVARLARPVQLIVIGAGPDRERLETIAHRIDARVRFLSGLSDLEVHRWLRTAHVLVTMSEREAFGVAALEAVAAGAAAICSDIDAHRELAEVTPGGAIRLVDPTAPAALDRALEAALSTERGSPAPVRSWTVVAAEYDEIYRSLLGRRSGVLS